METTNGKEQPHDKKLTKTLLAINKIIKSDKANPIQEDGKEQEVETVKELCEEAKELILKLVPTDQFGEDFDAERLYEIIDVLIPEAALSHPTTTVLDWDAVFEKYSKTISLELGEVRYVFIPFLNWLKENYPAQPSTVLGWVDVQNIALDYAERCCNGGFPIEYTRDQVVKHTKDDFIAGWEAKEKSII